MDLLKSVLKQVLAGDNVAQLAEQTNTSESAVKKAIKAGLPAILEGLNQNSNSKSGAESLSNALDKHDGSILDDIKNGNLSNIDIAEGSKIINHIFGDKKNAVASQLSKEAGMTKGQTSDLLSTLAPILMGALGQQKKEDDLDASGVSNLTTTIIGSLLSGGSGKNDLLSLVTGLLGGNSGNSGDGILDDILDKIF